jgi:16S rRNA (uracil1498-N3)-methyltransferase
MISRFFFPDALPREGSIALPEAVAHHATRVLRLSAGDSIVLFDGAGGEVAAVLEGSGKHWSATIRHYDDVERESPLEIVLVQGLASADKMDWIVRKAVELGAVGVVPVQAARSVLRLQGERAEKRVAHWQQIAISACEQSGRNRIPQIAPITDLSRFLKAHAAGRNIICSPHGGQALSAMARPEGRLHILIGPEGGWSDSELAQCLQANCEAVQLGPRVLRTETAGLAMLAAMQALWGDF